MSIIYFSSLLLILISGYCVHGYTEKVLIVSMDGFRWDYLNTISGLVNFEQMAREGVKAKYMNNTFVTVTFPNHFSMATGLYEESHGIVANKMYDPVFDDYFRNSNIETRWWEGGEPIWTTAKKNNKKVGTFFWPGTDVVLQGLLPDFYKPYNQSTPFEHRVDTVIDWFVNDGVDFATLYFHEPDKTGHIFGPDSQQIDDKVKEMDALLGYLMRKMAENNLDKTVNMIVTSDHGMTNVHSDQIIDLSTMVNMSLIKTIASKEDLCNILPLEGYEEEVYNALKEKVTHGTVYRKEDMPEHWHYKHNRRIHPVLVVMEEGWMCFDSANDTDRYQKGTHGYDNGIDNMKPIFLAKGPDFKINYKADIFRSVDIYELLCELLQVPPAPNNGSLSNTKPIINDNAKDAAIKTQFNVLFLILLGLIQLYF